MLEPLCVYWDFYLRMVFPVCCVDAALKQGGDPPHGSGIGDCYRPPRMVFPVCCVDVALKQGGDPPQKVKQGFRVPTREPQLVPPGPLATPGTTPY